MQRIRGNTLKDVICVPYLKDLRKWEYSKLESLPPFIPMDGIGIDVVRESPRTEGGGVIIELPYVNILQSGLRHLQCRIWKLGLRNQSSLWTPRFWYNVYLSINNAQSKLYFVQRTYSLHSRSVLLSAYRSRTSSRFFFSIWPLFWQSRNFCFVQSQSSTRWGKTIFAENNSLVDCPAETIPFVCHFETVKEVTDCTETLRREQDFTSVFPCSFHLNIDCVLKVFFQNPFSERHSW